MVCFFEFRRAKFAVYWYTLIYVNHAHGERRYAMTSSPGTDRDMLTRKAYADDEAYAIRVRTHDQYSFPQINFAEWVLDRVVWRGDETVLDIGAGSGMYFDSVRARIPNGRLFAGDLSLGMARKAAKNVHPSGVLNADAQTLPFPAHTFDVVLANHMLYHVPDLDKAFAEIHRVLKPQGVLLAATNSQFNMPELEQLIRRTLSILGASSAELERAKYQLHNFTLEDGARRASRHFFGISRHDLPGAFVFPSAKPATDYLNSMRALREHTLPKHIPWEDFIDEFGKQTQRLITHFGELVISKLSGVIIATDTGDFVQEYAAKLHNGVR
jgi:SAM-dependent methyltransferase